MNTSRLGRRALLAAVGILTVWTVLGVVTLLRAASELSAGQRDVQHVRSHLQTSDLEGTGPEATLRTARRHFAAGDRLLTSRIVAPAWALPVVGRQLEALRNLSSAAADVTAAGADAAADVRTALVASEQAGGDRVTLLRRMSEVADRTRTRLAAVPYEPKSAVFGAIRSRQTKFESQLAQLVDGLSRGGAASAALADLLQGPHRYLLLGANNAEMRAGSGMFLTAGVLETQNGHVHIRDVVQTASLHLDGEGVPLTGDMAARWGWAHPNREWRNLGMTPDFPATAELAVRMWAAATGEHLEGAVAVDAAAFADLLKYSGPVAGPAGQVTADNALRFLLHDQYTIGDPFSPDRHEALGDIAAQALGVLDHGKPDMKMASDLAGAADGRHILVWSADAAQQDRWQRARVTGALSPRDAVVSVLNRGANKLDQFLQVSARLEHRPEGADTALTLHVVLRNDTPTGEPPYIARPASDANVAEGVYKGIVSVNIPGSATRGSIDGAETYAAIGADGPTNVLAVPVEIPRGVTEEVVVRFREPGRSGAMRLLPSARIPMVSWDTGAGPFSVKSPLNVGWKG